MFWDRFVELCEKNGEKPNSVTKKLHMSNSIATVWKSGKIPTGTVLSQIADYFDVSVDYLLGRTDNPKGVAEVQILGYVDNENAIHAFDDLTGEELKKLLDFADMMRKARDK